MSAHDNVETDRILRIADRQLTEVELVADASAMSAPTFEAIWDTPEDAAYDTL